jgi:3-phosphoshikimate 1-carboxyvinyltransferase
MLRQFGAETQKKDGQIISRPVSMLYAQKITVPGDISSAAFFLIAGLITPGARLTVTGVGVNPTRTGLIDALAEMGGALELSNKRSVGGEPVADISVSCSALKPTTLSGAIIPRMIDEIPAFAVAALFAKGRTVIRDATELKVKESNRIHTIAEELGKMGGRLTETADGLIIDGGTPLHGAEVNSHQDHRIAMSLAVAALAAEGETRIMDSGCVDISFPKFFEQWSDL